MYGKIYIIHNISLVLYVDKYIQILLMLHLHVSFEAVTHNFTNPGHSVTIIKEIYN